MIIQLKNYQSDVENCTQTSISLWYSNRVNEFGNLHNKLSNLEGIQDAVPYKDKLDRLYEYLDISQKSSIEPELLHSAFFLY
jgi:hypothetical protein